MKTKFILLFTYSIILTTGFAQIPTDGLVGYWPFNGNANDESGYGNHGTVSGATLTTDRFGDANSAFYFDGNDKIEVSNSSILNFDDQTSFTINAWIEVYSNLSGSHGIIAKGAPDGIPEGAWQLLIGHQSSSVAFAEYGLGTNGAGIYGTQNLYTSAGWHFLSLVLDKSVNSMSLYIDGVLEATTTELAIASASAINNYPMSIGVERTTYQYFHGKIDDIRIYNHALTENEITELYNESDCSIPLPIVQDVTHCGPGSVTLTASGGTDYNWYDMPIGGNVIGTGPTYYTPYLPISDTLWVTNVDNCESDRVAVKAIINPLPDDIGVISYSAKWQLAKTIYPPANVTFADAACATNQYLFVSKSSLDTVYVYDINSETIIHREKLTPIYSGGPAFTVKKDRFYYASDM